jgi:hypothetical protein
MAIIAIDFDGTLVTHEYPKIGRDVGAISVLSELIDNAHQFILYTMRSDKYLAEAEAWCLNRNIPLFGVNYNPNQSAWTNSPKVYANLYIDDAALGIPLCKGLTGERPFVDWDKVRVLLKEKGYLS